MPIQTFRKRINNEKMRFYMPCGEKMRLTYMLHVDDEGCQCLHCTGQTDQYAKIQSYRDSCDLAMLLRNIDPQQVNGIMSSYSVEDLENSGIVDYSKNPQTLGGLFNLVKQGENMFNGLPEEVRKEFNYSVKNFVSKFGSPEFNDILAKYMAPSTNPVQNSDTVPTDSTEPTPSKPKEGDE